MRLLEQYGIRIEKEEYDKACVYGVACIYSLIEKQVSDFLRPFSLTPAKFNALMIIKHVGKEKGLSQIEIGRRLIVSASNMTRLLDKLEIDGFIERCSRVGDRRVRVIKISEKGSNILNEVWPGYHEKIKQIANYMNKQRQKDMVSLMGKWLEHLLK